MVLNRGHSTPALSACQWIFRKPVLLRAEAQGEWLDGKWFNGKWEMVRWFVQLSTLNVPLSPLSIGCRLPGFAVTLALSRKRARE